MIFSNSNMKLELKLEKRSFSPGETLQGKISLSADEPIKAKKLEVLFAGVGILVRRGVIGKNIIGSSEEPVLNLDKINLKYKGVGSGVAVSTAGRSEAVHPFFNREIQLEGKNEYSSGFYTFEFKIPNDVLKESENWIDKTPIANVAKRYQKPFDRRGFSDWNEYTKWFIEARLKISLGKDIKDRIEIKIVEKTE